MKPNKFSCLIALLLSYSTMVIANTETDPQWYQVEVVVFANNKPDAALEEQWPKELTLKYPERLVTLSQPLQSIETQEEQQTFDEQTSALIEELSEPQAQEESATLPQTSQPLKAFSALEADDMQLLEAATKISQQYDFRPLFHKAWRQTIENRNNATSIAINGGEAYDDHFELEGSIKISLERYLHINTDLWLNQFVSKTGENEPSLMLLPPVPSAVDETNASEQEIPFFAPINSFSTDNVNPETGEILPEQNAPALLSDQLQLAPQPDPLTEANQQLERQLALLEDAQFAVEQTIVMRQHRRMRSTELHYIDHPMFGVLIRIDPYEPESAIEAAE